MSNGLKSITDYFDHDAGGVNKKVIFITNQSHTSNDSKVTDRNFRQLLTMNRNLDVVSVNVDSYGRICLIGLSKPYNNDLFTKQGSFKCLSDFFANKRIC